MRGCLRTLTSLSLSLADLDVPSAVAAASDLVCRIRPWATVPVDGVAVGFDDGDFAVIYDRATSA
jgi:hypothetical protein